MIFGGVLFLKKKMLLTLLDRDELIEMVDKVVEELPEDDAT